MAFFTALGFAQKIGSGIGKLGQGVKQLFTRDPDKVAGRKAKRADRRSRRADRKMDRSQRKYERKMGKAGGRSGTQAEYDEEGTGFDLGIWLSQYWMWVAIPVGLGMVIWVIVSASGNKKKSR